MSREENLCTGDWMYITVGLRDGKTIFVNLGAGVHQETYLTVDDPRAL